MRRVHRLWPHVHYRSSLKIQSLATNQSTCRKLASSGNSHVPRPDAVSQCRDRGHSLQAIYYQHHGLCSYKTAPRRPMHKPAQSRPILHNPRTPIRPVAHSPTQNRPSPRAPSPRQAIPHPVHRQYPLRLPGIFLQLLPQPRDMHIHRAAGCHASVSPNLAQQRLARYRGPAVLHQVAQQLKLLGG